MTDNAPRPTRTTRYLAWSDDHHYLARAFDAQRELIAQCSVVAASREKARAMVMRAYSGADITCVDLCLTHPRGTGDSIDWKASLCLTEEGWAQTDLTPTRQYSQHSFTQFR